VSSSPHEVSDSRSTIPLRAWSVVLSLAAMALFSTDSITLSYSDIEDGQALVDRRV